MKRKSKIACVFSIIIVMVLLAGIFLKDLRQMLYFSAYSEHESSYLTDFYAGKNVLFLVPHEDDEYNLGGGIIEQYVTAGSDVKICYLTNGDAYGGGDVRIEESCKAMATLGLDASNLYFLGYGDTWDIPDEYSRHIYQAPPDEIFSSACGNTKTYGTPEHPDYHTLKYGESADYTRNNMKSDIADVIDDVLPDVIYCIECDKHPDHRALSLLFEEVIGEKLKTDLTYRPYIYKGFGYCTGWDGVRDYYADNIEGVKNPFETDIMDDKCILKFSDRLRFPVAAKTLAMTEHASSAYPVLDSFSSQDAIINLECLVNSDKVFWERRTESLLYTADISSDNSTGNLKLLNDFKLADTSLIDKKKNSKWNEGSCTINEGQSITISLGEKTLINQLVLYDNPFEDNDIEDMLITFDDGTTIETGKLYGNGSPTKVDFADISVSEITLTVTKATGAEPGLIEVEAYNNNDYYRPGFIKLVCDDNFMYDYYLKKGQEVTLSCYSYPQTDVTIYIDGQIFEEAVYKYDGKKHVVKAISADGKYYDEAVIMPLTMYREVLVKAARYIEKNIL